MLRGLKWWDLSFSGNTKNLKILPIIDQTPLYSDSPALKQTIQLNATSYSLMSICFRKQQIYITSRTKSYLIIVCPQWHTKQQLISSSSFSSPQFPTSHLLMPWLQCVPARPHSQSPSASLSLNPGNVSIIYRILRTTRAEDLTSSTVISQVPFFH